MRPPPPSCSPPRHGARGRSRPRRRPRANPPWAAVAETRTLIEQGRFEEALGILRPLAQGGAVEANVLFLIGLAATGASQQPDLSGDEREALLDEAIASLRAMLVDRPDLVRVRLELARAFFLKGENDLARKHFEHVLAGSPPGAVAANVRRFLSEIRARRRWSLRAGFALAPDTNIGGTSAERIIYINNLPFTRDADGTDDVGHRRLGMGRLGIPVSARRASSPAHRGRRLAA